MVILVVDTTNRKGPADQKDGLPGPSLVRVFGASIF